MNVRVTNPIQMKQGLDHVRCDEPICSRNQDSLSKKSIPRQIRGENRLQVLFNNGMLGAEQCFPFNQPSSFESELRSPFLAAARNFRRAYWPCLSYRGEAANESADCVNCLRRCRSIQRRSFSGRISLKMKINCRSCRMLTFDALRWKWARFPPAEASDGAGMITLAKSWFDLIV
jgi:hypothetical protein